MLLLLASLAFGGDEVFVVETGETETITGPSVWMGGDKYRRYVADSRNLPVCQDALEVAIQEGMDANTRTLDAYKLARGQFDSDEELLDTQVQTIADLGAKLDQERQRNARIRQQRNVAWGIAGGFLAASTAAVVLSLN